MRVWIKRWNFVIVTEGNGKKRKELRFIEGLIYGSLYGESFVYVIAFNSNNHHSIYYQKKDKHLAHFLQLVTEPEFEPTVFLASDPMTERPLGFNKIQGSIIICGLWDFVMNRGKSRARSKARIIVNWGEMGGWRV